LLVGVPLQIFLYANGTLKHEDFLELVGLPWTLWQSQLQRISLSSINKQEQLEQHHG